MAQNLTSRKHGMYLKAKGTANFDDAGPKSSDSCDILRSTLLTMSPKYSPDIIFSKPCSKILDMMLAAE